MKKLFLLLATFICFGAFSQSKDNTGSESRYFNYLGGAVFNKGIVLPLESDILSYENMRLKGRIMIGLDNVLKYHNGTTYVSLDLSQLTPYSYVQSNFVPIVGDVLMLGNKEFGSPPTVPNGTNAGHAVNRSQLDTKGNLTGGNTWFGAQTFNQLPNVGTAVSGSSNALAASTGFVQNALNPIAIEVGKIGIIRLDEGNGIGFVPFNRNANNYGNIGFNATDLSYSLTGGSTTYGATGQTSFATGYHTTASGANSHAGGNQSVASGQASMAVGSVVVARSDFEVAFGVHNTDYTPTGTDTDRIFSIGIGTSSPSVKKNAIEGFKNGIVNVPDLTISEISGEATGRVVVTREYLDSKFSTLKTQEARKQVSANVVLTTADIGANGSGLVVVDATGAARTVELPSPSDMQGYRFTIIKKDASANAVTVKGNGSTNINGSNTYLLTGQWQTAVISCDGVQYYIVN